MKLIDFNEDDLLNQLRANMGANDLGTFELFNPLKHLSWQDRQVLAKEWMPVAGNTLHASHDQSLYFKNSPVVAKIEETLHFAHCDEIKKRLSHGKLHEANVTTQPELFKQGQPCVYCLHAMKYEGFDAYRHRHQQYNDNILKSFSLTKFFIDKHPEFKTE